MKGYSSDGTASTTSPLLFISAILCKMSVTEASVALDTSAQGCQFTTFPAQPERTLALHMAENLAALALSKTVCDGLPIKRTIILPVIQFPTGVAGVSLQDLSLKICSGLSIDKAKSGKVCDAGFRVREDSLLVLVIDVKPHQD